MPITNQPQPPSGHDRFLDVEMPEWFVLEVKEDGRWLDIGFFAPYQFERLDDGTYVCGGWGASTTYIRCLAYRDEGIEHVDGGRPRWLYRLRRIRRQSLTPRICLRGHRRPFVGLLGTDTESRRVESSYTLPPPANHV